MTSSYGGLQRKFSPSAGDPGYCGISIDIFPEFCDVRKLSLLDRDLIAR